MKINLPHQPNVIVMIYPFTQLLWHVKEFLYAVFLLCMFWWFVNHIINNVNYCLWACTSGATCHCVMLYVCLKVCLGLNDLSIASYTFTVNAFNDHFDKYNSYYYETMPFYNMILGERVRNNIWKKTLSFHPGPQNEIQDYLIHSGYQER